jgi:hypothetical protein
MAAVPPITGNRCIGSHVDGTPHRNLLCYKGDDSNGDPILTCASWRKFRVNCPKVNFQCSSRSEAYVAAITVCNQRLF